MSSVWDDPELGGEELTPMPEIAVERVEASLPPEKLEALTVQVIEKVVREIVPELAERIIREELERLEKESA